MANVKITVTVDMTDTTKVRESLTLSPVASVEFENNIALMYPERITGDTPETLVRVDNTLEQSIQDFAISQINRLLRRSDAKRMEVELKQARVAAKAKRIPKKDRIEGAII